MSPLSLKTFTNNLDTNIVFPGNIEYGIRQWIVGGREREEGVKGRVGDRSEAKIPQQRKGETG